MNIENFVEQLNSCFPDEDFNAHGTAGGGFVIRIGPRDIQFDADLKFVGRGTTFPEYIPFGEIAELATGLYEVFWLSGGSSFASIGMLPDGGRWIAPTNWVAPSTDQSVWEEVKSVRLITDSVDDPFDKVFEVIQKQAIGGCLVSQQLVFQWMLTK